MVFVEKMAILKPARGIFLGRIESGEGKRKSAFETLASGGAYQNLRRFP